MTSSATGFPIAGIVVNFIDPTDQVVFTTGTTDVNGHYTTDGGTATGNVFAFTSNSAGYQNEVYTNGAGNPHCLQCDVLTVGTPIPVTIGNTTANIDFILDPGGKVTGTVTNTSASPLPNILVDVADSTGNVVDEVTTDALGNYISGGLPTGSYFAFTRKSKPFGLVDQFVQQPHVRRRILQRDGRNGDSGHCRSDRIGEELHAVSRRERHRYRDGCFEWDAAVRSVRAVLCGGHRGAGRAGGVYRRRADEFLGRVHS